MKRHKIFISSVIIAACLVFSHTLGVQYTQEVYEAQKALKQLGYNPGILDGLWGKTTMNAVKKFQSDIGLPVTGQLDFATKKGLGLKSAEQARYGFEGIPFGLTYKETLDRVLRLKDQQGNTPEIKEGPDKKSSTFSFGIGERECDIKLHFDYKNRYYGFTIFPKTSFDKKQFNRGIREQTIFFEKTFTEKYGDAAFCKNFPIPFLTEQSFVRVVCVWKNNVIYAITGISEDIKKKNHYFGMGRVIHRSLAREYFEHQSSVGPKSDSGDAAQD